MTVEEREAALIEQAKALAAQATPANSMVCIYGEPVFYLLADHAVIPGHIYSSDGRHEMQQISHCCEYHFDEMFADDDDEGR